MAMASNRLNRVEVSSSPVEVQYAESLKTIEAIAKFLLCVECDNLPTEKVFTLDCCTSKYCESCVKFSGGKQCVVCKKKRFPKDVKKDLFSTSILIEIPAVYEVLGGFKNLTCDIARANNCTKRRNTDSPDVTLPPASSKRTKLTSAVAALTKAETNVNEMALSKTGEDKLSVLFGSPAVLDAPENQPLVTNRRRKNSTSSSIGNSSILNSSIDSKDIEKRNEKGETALHVNEMALSSPVLFGSPAVLNAPKNQLLVTNRRRKNSTSSSIGNSSILNSSIDSKDIEKRNEKGETALNVNEMALSSPVLFGSPGVLNAPKNQPLVTNRRRKNSTSSSIGNSSILNSSIDSKDIEKRNEKGETALNVNEMALSSPVLFGSPAVLDAPKNQPLVTNRGRKNSTPSSIGNSSILNSSIGSKDIEKRNEKGETALHVACRGGYLDKVKSLVEEGANVEAQDYAGWTPLHELINGKGSVKVKMNILKFLRTNKCDVNAPGGPEEETPLHLSAQYGFDQIVELLLDLGASPNVRQSEGKLPKDLAFNEKVLRVLEERTTSLTTSPSSYSNNTADASMTDEDPVVLQVMIKKAVIFFDFDVSRDTIESTKNILGLKISMNFTNKVTHIVHDLGKSNDDLLAPMSLRYLFGVAKGLWQVSYKWIERSIEELKCLSPTSFEIRGCSTVSRIPCLTRVNHEKGNPSLLDGFTFYLYKMCGYKSETNPRFKLSRGELVSLIEYAGGNLTNRFPDPNAIDPLDAPRRFHVQHSSQSVTFSLTTHIVLYDDQCYPPESKRFNMEHVKTLKSSWVVDCISKFALLDPEKYLQM